MRKLFVIGQVEIDWRHVDLILMGELLELSLVVWRSLKLFARVDLLVVDHRDQHDVHATIDGTQNLLLLIVVWLVNVVWPLVEIDCFKFRNVVVETRKNYVGDDLVRDTSLTNVFDNNWPRNLFVLESLRELFVCHSMFLGFAKAISLLESLVRIGLQLWACESVNFLVFSKQI